MFRSWVFLSVALVSFRAETLHHLSRKGLFAFVIINFSSSKLLCATPRQASFRAGGGMQVGGERSLELAARSRLSV